MLEAVVAEVRQLEDERLVEDRVQGSLLDVGLLLGDALVVVEQVDLHVGIWNKHLLRFSTDFLKQYYYSARWNLRSFLGPK